MKKWKIIKIITIIVLILFLIGIVVDLSICMNMSYPHPMLGIDALNWKEQFRVDLIFLLIIASSLILLDIILLIVSINKLKNSNK